MLFSRSTLDIGQSTIRPFSFKQLIYLFPLIASGCASAPLEQAGSLASYDGLSSANSKLTKAKFKTEGADLLLVKKVYIEPTVVSAAAISTTKSSSDRALVANAIDRALCVGVSDRFEVVEKRENADFYVHATITHIVPTNAPMAGVSTVTSLGSSFVLPVGIPRLPVGLGGLSVEAEAVNKDGKQLAAMVWAKGANSLTTKARVSPVGDAYSLATSFGNDFSTMLVTGKTPFKGWPKLPSSQKMKSSLGGKPKYPACERFGRAPGLADMAAGQLGLPPSWTDREASKAKQ
ncbi:DUF3313 domain-containing protein [Agrobacterium vitis]|uniref:DUF3313 domain-containing protein n=1 Tax=Rhizobium/Agrobacterium group TaxID=227290 RepID=UPI001F45433C|nr:DUF3313 domain-containing protein [Allorhizobium ampelinum]MCF1485128.1 DUF3313 domain-containing protein [Allorhizobium ampelinum]